MARTETNMQLTINPFLNTLEVLSEIDGKEVYKTFKYTSLSQSFEFMIGRREFTVYLYLKDKSLLVSCYQGEQPIKVELIIELLIEQPYEIN